MEKNELNVGKKKGELNVLRLNWNPEDNVLSLEVKWLTDRFVSIKNSTHKEVC